jgi:hypothetical protein
VPFIRCSSDDAPHPALEAFRKQVRGFIDAGDNPGIVLFAWLDAEPGLGRDDLIDAFKEETGEKPRPSPRPRPGAVQESPFA